MRQAEDLVTMGMSVLAELATDPEEGTLAEMFGELMEEHGIVRMLDLLHQATVAAAEVHPSEPRLRTFALAVGSAIESIR